MRAPIVWLMSSQCAVTGRRFIAKQWREDLPPSEAAAQAQSPLVESPAIL